MKKKLMILFLIIVTIVCILLGINVRYNNRIKITQLGNESNGYIIETAENHLIIIDGGTKENADYIVDIIKEKGNPPIIGWYLTSILPEYSGALAEMINNDVDVDISNIFVSFITDENWYKNSNVTERQMSEIENIKKTVLYGKYSEIIRPMERRAEYQMENYYITPLEIKEEVTYKNIEEQNVVLKITNGFENVLFLGKLSENRAKNFLTSNQDQFKNISAIQIAGNEMNDTVKEIIDMTKPEKIFTSEKMEFNWINVEQIYKSKDKNNFVEIW